MPSLSKQEFMSKVRDALCDRGERVDLPTDLEIARVIKSDGDLVQVFLERVELAGMKPYRVADESALAERVKDIVRESGASSVIMPDEQIPGQDAIRAALNESNISWSDADDPDAAFDADIGITTVDAAVAETGSMCIDSGGHRRRLASLAVPTHIGIVPAEKIVADLLDFGEQCGEDMPANRVLVSGPSKTADIEMTIIEGVHGPKTEHVIVIG